MYAVTYDVTSREVRDNDPAHLWPEARNPANQWLKNITGPGRLEAERHAIVNAAIRAMRREFRAAGYPVPPPRIPQHDDRRNLP